MAGISHITQRQGGRLSPTSQWGDASPKSPPTLGAQLELPTCLWAAHSRSGPQLGARLAVQGMEFQADTREGSTGAGLGQRGAYKSSKCHGAPRTPTPAPIPAGASRCRAVTPERPGGASGRMLREASGRRCGHTGRKDGDNSGGSGKIQEKGGQGHQNL